MASYYPAVAHCPPAQPSQQAYPPIHCSPFEAAAPFPAQPAGYPPVNQAPGPSVFSTYPSMAMASSSYSSFSGPASTATTSYPPPPGYPQGPAVGQYPSMTYAVPPPPIYTTVAPATQQPEQSKMKMVAQVAGAFAGAALQAVLGG